MKKSITPSDFATDFANKIVNTQPLSEDILTTLTTLYNGSKTESELKDDGYEPVSPMGLMWVKKI